MHVLIKTMVPPSCTVSLNGITKKEYNIQDKVSFVVNDMRHESCLNCKECEIPLMVNYYRDKDYFFCKEHYYNRSCSPKCGGCNNKILYNQLAVPLGDMRYHVDCVTCFICGVSIEEGHTISIKEVRGPRVQFSVL